MNPSAYQIVTSEVNQRCAKWEGKKKKWGKDADEEMIGDLPCR